MVVEELEGRKGKQADGAAKTREVKLGCVFSQTKTDEEGVRHARARQAGPTPGPDGPRWNQMGD
jgi:hypothetical protein